MRLCRLYFGPRERIQLFPPTVGWVTTEFSSPKSPPARRFQQSRPEAKGWNLPPDAHQNTRGTPAAARHMRESRVSLCGIGPFATYARTPKFPACKSSQPRHRPFSVNPEIPTPKKPTGQVRLRGYLRRPNYSRGAPRTDRQGESLPEITGAII